jgi:hypothetical protein
MDIHLGYMLWHGGLQRGEVQRILLLTSVQLLLASTSKRYKVFAPSHRKTIQIAAQTVD